MTYEEDKDYIAIDPKDVDQDKLAKQLNKEKPSAIFVEYDPIKGGR